LRIPFGPVLELDVQYCLLLPEARLAEPAITAVRDWFMLEAEAFAPRLREFVRSSSASPSGGRASR